MNDLRRRRTIPSLTAAEREIILTIADDEQSWHVHTDSRRAFSTRLLKVARALGITPERQGVGWAFSLPLQAIRAGVPGRRRGRPFPRRLDGPQAAQTAREDGQSGHSGGGPGP